MSIADKLNQVAQNVPLVYQAGYDKGYEEGSKSGGGGSSVAVQKKDVNFYDYDGTRLYSYTVAEAQALTELPELPTQAGLICQGWNYDLATIKSYKRAVDVGATYITDDGKTRLYIHIDTEGRMTVPLCFSQSVANGVEIDWGDGSSTQKLSGTGTKSTTHTYSSTGDYVITFTVANGCTLNFGNGKSSSTQSIMGSTGSEGRVYNNMLRRIEIGNGVTSIKAYGFYYCLSLASITIPNGVSSIGNYAFQYCGYLASIIIPNGVSTIDKYALGSCGSIKTIILPDSVLSIGSYGFTSCNSLTSIILPNSVSTIGDRAFLYGYSLESIIIPSGVSSIEASTFNSCWGLAICDFTACTSVPSLANTNAFGNVPSDCKIKVPSSLLSSWKAATNWSTYASQIVAG